jgi:transposase
VFSWVLKIPAEEGLWKGTTAAIDGTTLEANAAMRSIVKPDNGEVYDEFLERLAKESGIETPTREQLAKIDRKHPKKGSNEDWENPPAVVSANLVLTEEHFRPSDAPLLH